MKDQLDCVLNVLQELGNKQLFLNHQYNTGIFFLLLLLLPCILSIEHQTSEQIVGIDSEDLLLFSRNEPLRLLLDAFVVNDEEETLLSRFFILGERIFPWFNIDPIPSFNGNNSW